MSRSLSGHCHCGGVSAVFETALADEDIETRACQCSFCRRHGAITISDPEGRLTLLHVTPVLAYRFATQSADFLLCGKCGMYLAAMLDDEGERRAVLNVRAIPLDGFVARPATPVDYEEESAKTRRARRLRKWMPASVLEQPHD